jgi:diguanylate cyclase (GGDEF)-like protein/PAS domain S-box-containing protein
MPLETKRGISGEMNEIQTLKTSQEIVVNSIDAIVVVDEDTKISYVNPALERLSEYEFRNLKNKQLSFILPREIINAQSFPSSVDRFLLTHKEESTKDSFQEFELETKTGQKIPIEIRVFQISPDGEKLQFAAIIRDIRERKRMEEERQLLISSLKKLAYMDELTLLPNRRSFYDSLQKSIAIVKRRKREAVLGVIDIDHFKQINDTYGHDVGDLVLKNISIIFNESLREEDTIGRVGGEEFGCILPDTNVEGAKIVFERVLESVRRHRFFVMDNFYLNVTVSLGFTKIHPNQEPEEAIKLADIALYQAKSNGRDCIQSYPET